MLWILGSVFLPFWEYQQCDILSQTLWHVLFFTFILWVFMHTHYVPRLAYATGACGIRGIE